MLFPGRDDSLKVQTCTDIVNNCPHLISLALRGFKLHDCKIRVLVKVCFWRCENKCAITTLLLLFLWQFNLQFRNAFPNLYLQNANCHLYETSWYRDYVMLNRNQIMLWCVGMEVWLFFMATKPTVFICFRAKWVAELEPPAAINFQSNLSPI